MDGARNFWYFRAMVDGSIPTWQLYGEVNVFPDILHVEQVVDRAASLDWTIGLHRHLHLHQILLLTSGNINLTLDAGPTPVIPPVVINIPRGTVHGFSFSAGTEGTVVTLPADEFPDLFTPPAETAPSLARAFTMAADPAICLRFRALAIAHAANTVFRRTLVRAEVAGLVALVTEKAQAIHGDHASIDARILRLQTIVRTNVSRRFNLQDLADALAMSPRNLSRLCKLETGLTVQRYFEAQRMQEACRMLVYTDMSGQQIAFQLGFDDPSYFSRVFQRNFRLSPSAYRSRFER
jgi:AraC family transcriptional regulator, transcriptional activator of pobA